MKLSTIAGAALCATVTSAAPAWSNKNDLSIAKDGHKSPFDFTSTFKVIATPEQVVNGSNAPTGGLDVSNTRFGSSS
jgi:hypothetical protein